jgi:hypothetical protein
MKRYFINLLFILIALMLVARGMEDVVLSSSGESAQARITYAEKAGFSRYSSRTYRVHYEFTLPDGSLQTGVTTYSHSGGEPTGWLNVRYFSFRPGFNKPDGASIVLSAGAWILGGLGLILFQLIRIRKKSRKYARAKRIAGDGALHAEDPGMASPTAASPSAAAPSRGFLSSLAAFLVLVGIGAGMTYFLFIQPNQPPSPSQTEEIVSAVYGNTQGNVANGGIAVREGSTVYFANFADNQRLYRVQTDGSALERMTDESVSNLNFSDGWIYFCNFDEEDRIYRIRPDGTGMTRVYKWKSQDVSLSGGWLFLSNGNDHDRIYRVRADGKQELQLNADESENLSLGGGWIYYVNATDGDRLYRIRTNGTERGAVVETPVSTIIADETGVFFTTADEGILYRMEHDATTPMKILDQAFGLPNILDGKIYYQMDDGSLGVMKTDGSGAVQAASVPADFISLLGDKAMVVDFMESDFNYLVDLATGNAQRIE